MNIFIALPYTTEIFFFISACQEFSKGSMVAAQNSILETTFTIMVLEPVSLLIGQNSTYFIMGSMGNSMGQPQICDFTDNLLTSHVRGDATKLL